MPGSAKRRLERIRSAIDQHQGRLIRFAARITGSIDTAREVVQDTFLKLCKEDLDGLGDHLPAWLFRVCRNGALDVRKKEGFLSRTEMTDAVLSNGNGGDPHQHLLRSDEARRVRTALLALPASQREVLRLRFEDELSYKEIAAVTSHSVSNVGVLIHTAVKTVRQRLSEGPKPPAPLANGDRRHA